MEPVPAPSATAADLAAADCAREPVHVIGRTQAHGFLVAVAEPALTVRFVSANVASALATSLDELLERPLEAVFGESDGAALRTRLREHDLSAINPLRVAFAGRAMDCVAHRHAGLLLLELEPNDGAYGLERLNVATHLERPMARMDAETGIETLTLVAASEIRRLSGFERVIVYRFDPDWNGQVIGESTDGVPKYLGHYFPASDIPAQARRLFLINTLRTIVDVQSTGVPVVPVVDPWSTKPLDLSHSLLRSASPVHLEYLKNMGVCATMTVSIIVRGELWGIVTAHHSSPHRIDFSRRAICKLLGQVLGAQISGRSDRAVVQERLHSRERIEAYMSSLERTPQAPPSDAFDSMKLMALMHADGVVTRIDGVASHFGTTVDDARLQPAIAALRGRSTRGIASSTMLAEFGAQASAYAREASGALYIGLSETSDDAIVLLRRELVQTILWAGDPNKSTTPDATTGRLHPRTSFDSWRQRVRGRSRAWSDLELENARLLREQFMQLREAQQRHKAEERVRYLAHFDPLTGLPNRSSIQETLERSLERAVRDRASLAVLFVDLDHFKHFNDKLGHAAGDRILQIIAARMRHAVRAEDTVGRLGGDEFIAILPGADSTQHALEAAARLLAEIEKPLEFGEAEPLRITASIGISRYPSDGGSAESLLKHSDVAMYRAKEGGRNACKVFA